MKKLFLVSVLLAVSSVSILSCGGISGEVRTYLEQMRSFDIGYPEPIVIDEAGWKGDLASARTLDETTSDSEKLLGQLKAMDYPPSASIRYKSGNYDATGGFLGEDTKNFDLRARHEEYVDAYSEFVQALLNQQSILQLVEMEWDSGNILGGRQMYVDFYDYLDQSGSYSRAVSITYSAQLKLVAIGYEWQCVFDQYLH